MPTIEGSHRYLSNYIETLLLVDQHQEIDLTKGKQVIDVSKMTTEVKAKQKYAGFSWILVTAWPWISEINVDGSFCYDDKQAGIGVIIRDEKGVPLLSTCLYLQPCLDPLDDELAACEEGMIRATRHTQVPIFLETDSAEAINLINHPEPPRSRYRTKKTKRKTAGRRYVHVAGLLGEDEVRRGAVAASSSSLQR
ncbi:LOW QUALITY PROTEIN: hypothetical protein BRADI_4g20562v3 [Brachypodium distachyon]|uniref:RNase H type-1 domain-containing protein n=1 Tax=Brachypodium distachyon TaxID=15368 RepID=A0A2K2CNY9_BRADI|nr:LOW QUALITY PROTEIN: hypothetical protein BRADI_4g20562v3 [Brachypodium distachyon]